MARGLIAGVRGLGRGWSALLTPPHQPARPAASPSRLAAGQPSRPAPAPPGRVARSAPAGTYNASGVVGPCAAADGSVRAGRPA